MQFYAAIICDVEENFGENIAKLNVNYNYKYI